MLTKDKRLRASVLSHIASNTNINQSFVLRFSNDSSPKSFILISSYKFDTKKNSQISEKHTPKISFKLI